MWPHSFILPLKKISLALSKSNLNYLLHDSRSLLQQGLKRCLFAGPAWPLARAKALLAITTNASAYVFQGQPPPDAHLREDQGAAMGLGPHLASRHGTGTPDIGVLPLSLMPTAFLLLLGPTGELPCGAVGGGNF